MLLHKPFETIVRAWYADAIVLYVTKSHDRLRKKEKKVDIYLV